MPEYIRLPAGHGDVQVKLWTYFMNGGKYFVKTTVSTPLAEVVGELTAETATEVHDFTDYPHPEGDDRESYRAWLVAMDVAGQRDQVWRYDRARALARPRWNGGYGQLLPDSFVIITMEGPGRTESHDHHLYYRLTPLSKHETLVEVWDYKRFDT